MKCIDHVLEMTLMITRMMGLSDGRKSFPIGLAVLIQYRSVTAAQPATQPRCRSYYAQRSGVEPNKPVPRLRQETDMLVFIPNSEVAASMTKIVGDAKVNSN